MMQLKRALDVCGAAVGLAALAPLHPILALAIRLDSKGPVLFRQRRVSGVADPAVASEERYRTFTLLKYRTMRVDAERRTGPVLASEGDPRVTTVGRFLRATRLDELPQLWNVLRGDMSLVGPRPERPELLLALARAVPAFDERLRVKPGLTGPAQVNLGYTGAIREWSPLFGMGPTLENPFALAGAEGALADDMRAKLLYDLAYVAESQRPLRALVTDLRILALTPWIMLKKLGA